MRRFIALTILGFLCWQVSSASLFAQRGGGAPRPAPAPAPRWPDGRINLGAPLGETGVWERRNEHLVINPKSYQADATKTARMHIDQVPLQPWARGLTNYRHADLTRERAVYPLQAGRRAAAVHVAVRTGDRGLPRAQTRLHLQHLERDELPRRSTWTAAAIPRTSTRVISDTRSAAGTATRWSSTRWASARTRG